jgi:hypothetical protein
VFFKSDFRLKMHKNIFFRFIFIFNISTSKPLENTKKTSI